MRDTFLLLVIVACVVFIVCCILKVAYLMGAADMKECYGMGAMQTACIKELEGD